MLAHVLSLALRGVESYVVRVEVNLAPGLPGFSVVGLAQGAVKESRERVTAALSNCGFKIPPRKITVNLAPADVRKDGSTFDLPIAVALLAGAGRLAAQGLEDVALAGELGLDGELRPIRGALPLAVGCKRAGVASIVLPADNAQEAAAVEGVAILGARNLSEVLAHLSGEQPLTPARVDTGYAITSDSGHQLDLSDVRGLGCAKRALEVAAAGAHHLLMIGPPGSGKTLLARRMPGILPPMTLQESVETTMVHSVAGTIPPGATLLTDRPFRSPHHTVSDIGLVGGGSAMRPGEASLAHNGILFLDELPEFRRSALESLRQPIEDGIVAISRAHGTVSYPCRFTLVAAMNPCPCGHYGAVERRCTCDPVLVARYRRRISGPLLDRFDLRIEVYPVDPGKLLAEGVEPLSGPVRQRVTAARHRQRERMKGSGFMANAQMGPAEVRRWCLGQRGVTTLIRNGGASLGLSARGIHRVLKVARTIADIDGEDVISEGHAAEALQYRTAA